MSPALGAAMRRLHTALGQLETALARRLDGEAMRSDLEIELQVMQDDRSRLATELESAAARVAQVEAAAEHVERRVQGAIGTIRDVLGRADRTEPGA